MSIRQQLESLTHHWYKKTPIYSLLPFAKCYQSAVAVRRFYYQKFKKIQKFNVPIIVIGNLTVGGTGKTPLVIWLAKFLSAQGCKPGIISRGYGGKSKHYPLMVTKQSDPLEVGDEPLLIARHTDCPVLVDPNRVQAATKLLQTTDCNILISDDGLQHYNLTRDLEIVVIDGERRFGNGSCLPAGPLREPKSRLLEADFVVSNGIAQKNEYSMSLMPSNFVQIKNPALTVTVDFFQDKTVHAIAGIGNPDRFFSLLDSLGIKFKKHVFPDHYQFQKADLEFGSDVVVIMTEKDAVKCEKFADEQCWYLPVQAQLPAEFSQRFLSEVILITRHVGGE